MVTICILSFSAVVINIYQHIVEMRLPYLVIMMIIIMNTCQGAIVWSSKQKMLQVNGQRFNLKGASWFGFQTNAYTVHGLWAVDYKFIIDFLATNQFNAVRLPFSLDMVINNPNPSTINYGYCSNNVNCNLDLKGLTSMQVLDKIIDYMGTKGIAVMLDMHSFQPDAASNNGLWYDSTHPQSTVIQGWRTLVARYQNTWNVFAIDVKNEPFQATWNSGNNSTDFNTAAQRIGNAVVNDTNWLVFVQGITCNSGCFWGQNLQGVQSAPVVLNVPYRVVYSPHVYGPDVYYMSYFSDASFPANMPSIWDSHFGFIRNVSDAALVVGQWGGTTTNAQNLAWLNAFASYLKTNKMADNFFWDVNPNSGGTGGLLMNDWIAPETAKLNILASVVPSPTNLLLAVNTTTNSTTNSTNSTTNCTTNCTSNKTNTTGNTTNANKSCSIVYTSQQGVLKINGQRFYLKGASWFGFQTSVSTVHGLWSVDYKFLVDFMASNQFNAVRLPFSLDMVLNNPMPNSISYGYCSNNVNCNMDLKGLSSLQVMDKIISYMGTKGILVMLDMHSFAADAYASNGLWYDSTHSEALVIQGWRALVARYQNVWNVFAADLKNEPFQATWNTGNNSTDFNTAAQRIGNAIVNDTNWLIFVEGTGSSPACTANCFYGQDLIGVQTAPVVLNVAKRVVYSPHTYGPDVYNQPYFSDSTFPINMPAIWDDHFGFIKGLNSAAVVTGQWGGSTSGNNGIWLNAYANYLKSKDMTDNFVWCLNPNSGDTGGLLLNDWVTPDSAKLGILAGIVPNPTIIFTLLNSTNVGTNCTSSTNTTNPSNTTTNSTNCTNCSNTTNTTNSTNTTTNASTCGSRFSSQQGVLKINGQRFYLKGASWFGFQTSVSTVHGLWSVDYKFLVDFMASNQFNAVRLPFSLDMVLNNPMPNSISYGYCSNNVNCNMDLKGLSSLQVMDKIISYMGTKGILVMLDMHSFAADAYASNGLWYDSTHSEALVIQGWRALVARYQNVWNVFAADLKNEPFQATWNTGNNSTDFNTAAQRIGNAIVNDTNWLIFVEGTGSSPACTANCFYGQDLIGVQTAPVQLSKPGRVVYSPHTYGPNVYAQSYFSDPNYPNNMPSIWDAHFGFIKGLNSAAVVTGQWGGSTTGTNGIWLNAYANYLKSKDMTDNFFWCVNPNSGDTGGLLLNDWVTPDTAKLSVLANIVPQPSNVLALMNVTANCTGNNSTNNTGNNTNSTNTNCSSGQTSNGTSCVNCTVFACVTCTNNASLCSACLPTLYTISDGSFCELCLLATTYGQCSQGSCSGFIFYNSQCINTCSNITNFNPRQVSPINGACLCNFGYVWSSDSSDGTTAQCLSCSSQLITQSQCLSSQCPSYFWSIFGTVSFCNSCVNMGGTVTNGTCICPSGSIWDAPTNYCYTCDIISPSQCGMMTTCSNYYFDPDSSSCTPCGANTINRTSTTPQTTCTCPTGFSWSNGNCNSCLTSKGQYLYNGSCLNCPTVNALRNGTSPQSNSSGCLCAKNYQFLMVGSSYQCTCNNTAGQFDLGNGQGCATCINITGASTFNQTLGTCNCVFPLTWNSPSQRCMCAGNNTYLKLNTVCALCSEILTNLGANPLTINSCLCSNITVWNSSYSQCVCKGNGTVLNQYFNGITCIACDSTTLGIMDGYNKCLCPVNSAWTTLSYSCVCNSVSISINKACVVCSSLPNGVAPTSNKLACTCATGWSWSSNTNSCTCLTSNCNCLLVPNTAFSTTSKTCQPCSSFDVNALPTWATNQTTCSCKGAYVWQTSNICLCPIYSTANPVIVVNISCILCSSSINSLNSGVSNSTTRECSCFTNYVWSSTFLICSFAPNNASTVTVQFLNGNKITCPGALTSAVSALALDNYNCMCANNNSIFNDLKGTCIKCTLGKINAVTCKCPSGQDWNIIKMSCASTKPPGNKFDNPLYAKCTQSPGLASSSLVAYSPKQANQVYVSGELDFIALASKSTLYVKYANFKCSCASGYGWNAARKRCLKTVWSYVY